ncbi:aminoacyl-tRNA hydrolase [Propylenella binzhouense]|uniref:Peptidyl-tRNA hydrolase n=1 Tax=Propylenella binzhouense TaxID=2555902 RepID=A0A964T1X6_9HYPH|nr:aminoacyl-tRNA hydrolase [Propylenella binzhouense]MYZ46749.1 aminoacyl-tRNA hydrolase [Propylenella binzhouense]
MLLIVGLGNPGRRYAGNRHNIGFMAADEIARRHRFGPWRARFEGEIAEGSLGGEKALILKPATYMNESGRSVGQALRFYKLQPSDVVVIHDELDLSPGKLRMKTGGGHGGHNGLKSLDAHIGKEYRRMRLGIGHPGRKELVHGYVLHDFAKDDQDWIQPLLSAVAENAPLLSGGEDSSFMNRVHLATEGDAAPQSERRSGPVPAGPAPDAKPKAGALAEGLKRLFGRTE